MASRHSHPTFHSFTSLFYTYEGYVFSCVIFSILVIRYRSNQDVKPQEVVAILRNFTKKDTDICLYVPGARKKGNLLFKY